MGDLTPHGSTADSNQPQLHYVCTDQRTGKALFMIDLPRLDVWPGTTDLPSGSIGLLIACDATGYTSAALAAAARAMLLTGPTFIAIWGPGCERFHDIVDEECVWLRANGQNLPEVVTTWHAEESLDESLWFFIDCAQILAEQPVAWMAVSVRNPCYHAQIAARFNDLPGLREAVLNEST